MHAVAYPSHFGALSTCRIVSLLTGNTTSGISFLFDHITGTLKEAQKMRRNI
jgi:uncharacterized protein YPO0396